MKIRARVGVSKIGSYIEGSARMVGRGYEITIHNRWGGYLLWGDQRTFWGLHMKEVGTLVIQVGGVRSPGVQ